MHEQMKEALKNRKGKGPSMQAEAPPAPSPMKTEDTEMSNLEKLASLVKDNPEASAIVAEIMGERSEEVEEAPDMTSDMSDYDKQDVMSREKPRSLFERAQKDALMKGKK